MQKFPSFSQWKQLLRVLKRGEKTTLLVFLIFAVSSLGFLLMNFYFTNTKPVPGFGGTYVEGIVGQPRFINPIYGETNDIDRTLIDLVFSGLQAYDKDGNLVNDLVKEYEISSDGRTYTFTLKDNTYWHDGFPLTADDVIFTVKTIQNSDYKSPLRANWIDIETKKISDRSFSFTLKQPYTSFLENCTLKIIPQHIWQHVAPENFTLSSYNIQPIGSGPFAFSSLQQSSAGFIQSLKLQSNRQYFEKPSFIATVTFRFFEKTSDLLAAASTGKINGFAVAGLDKNNSQIPSAVTNHWPNNEKFAQYNFSLPRYFAVFFNAAPNGQKNGLFSDINIRKALSYGVNKEELLQTINNQSGSGLAKVDSPILPDFYGYQNPTTTYAFDIAQAKTLLDKAGFKENSSGLREKAISKKPAFQFKSYLKTGSKGNEVIQLQACLSRLSASFKEILSTETNGTYGKGTESAVTDFQKLYLPNLNPTGELGTSTRQKLNELCLTSGPNSQPLAFTLVTINQPRLVETANALKNYWQNLGVTVSINAVSITDLKPIIKNRSYDALLYGETLGMQPDPYPFWYSSQKQDPGLNLSSYENKDVDKLLKEARQTLNPSQKQKALEQIQNIIVNEAPALFLYNPDYVYWISEEVKGLDTTKIADPAKRFSNIKNWYLKTKRAWKQT